jgi:hypothetical protein
MSDAFSPRPARLARVRQWAVTDRAIALALVVFCLAVYLPGITWGIPAATHAEFVHGWGNDDLVPLPVLAEMDNTFRGAKPDRNIAYPWFHYMLVGCAFGPYLVYLLVSGGLSQPVSAFPFGLTDPTSVFRDLSLIGRAVTLMLALATVLGSYAAGRYLWGKSAGLLAALFTALMFPMAYYARLGNPDVPSLAWTSLALAVVALIVRGGLTPARGAWLGAFVALAFATKSPFGSFVLVGPAVVLLHLRRGDESRLWRWTGVWVAPCAAAASFLGVYVVASGIPVDPGRFIQHAGKAVGVLGPGHGHVLRYPPTLSGYADQAQAMIGYLVDVLSWPGLVLAVLGITLAVRRDRASLTLALSSLGFFILVLLARFTRPHYLLPVALPLTLFVGYALARGLRASRPVRLVTGLAACATLGYLLLATVDLTHDMLRDSRYEAGAWLNQQTRPTDRVLFFDPPLRLPPLPAHVQVTQVFHRAEARATVVATRPDFIIVNPDDTNEESQHVEWKFGSHSVYSDYVPADLFRSLVDESIGYRLVAKFQSPRLMPWLDRPFLSYPSVNPPFHVFGRVDRFSDWPRLEPWETAPHNPPYSRVLELTVDLLREGRYP